MRFGRSIQRTTIHDAIGVASLLCAGCSAILGIEDREVGDVAAIESADGDGSAPPSNVPVDGDAGGRALERPDCVGSPYEGASVLRDECGLFVSPSGDDLNIGTRARPLKTIGRGVALAVNSGMFRVFVCDGVYPDRIEMSQLGASIVGGLSCANGSWAPGTAPTTVRPTTLRPQDGSATLRIRGTTNRVVIENIHVEASPAAASGASSIAAQIINAGNVSFVRSELVAGAGAAGAPGAGGAVASGGGQPGNNSGNGTLDVPAAAQSCQCKLGTVDFGTTVGGAGSAPGAPAAAGSPALGGGGPGADGTPCTNGTAGAGGASGETAPTPNVPGAIVGEDWVPTTGGNGSDGTIGQGGGGGGGDPTNLNSEAGGFAAGGGGGCGGCPSTGAKGGQGGGASIGVLLLDSTVAFVDTKITTGAAGKGGAGGEAPGAQAGGAGGVNVLTGGGCVGGAGGRGGEGGPGGGGAGGVSIGILHRGKAPTVDAATDGKITVGAAGDAGQGRIGGPKHFAPGPSGLSQKIYAPGT